MLSGRGLCDELITHPEESYRLWCAVVCDLETVSEEAFAHSGVLKNASYKKGYKQRCLAVNNEMQYSINCQKMKGIVSFPYSGILYTAHVPHPIDRESGYFTVSVGSN